MAPTAAFWVVAFTALGVLGGWHFRRAQDAHGNIKSYKARIPAFRKVRNRSAVATAVIVTLGLLALSALVR